MEKTFSYANLQHGLMSPIGLNVLSRDDGRDERLFQPCVMVQPPEHHMISPSKLISLTPTPKQFSLFEKPHVLSKRLTFGL